MIDLKQIIHHRCLPDIDIDVLTRLKFLPASNDSMVELCDELWAIYVNVLR